MSQNISGIHKIFSYPLIYSLVQIIMSGVSVRSTLVKKIINKNAKILDIGCGTGKILESLPAVDYYGYDISKKYINYAKKKGYNKLITMDSDLSHNPKEIPKFIDLLGRYNFVQGSRYISGGKNNQPKFRYLLSYIGNKLIKIILNSELNEHTTSFRGFNINKLKNFNLGKVKAGGYSFFMETIYRLKLDNFSMVEIPIIFNDRIHGQSKIPKIEIFRTLFNLIKILIKKLV